MFGHLDDPAPNPLGDDALAGVLQRAHRLRLRRRLGTVVAAGLIVVAGAAGFLVSRPATVPIPSSETGYQFNALKGPLRVGTPVPTTSLLNVVFVDAQVGFALAGHRGDAVLAESTDGGSTWQVRNDRLPSGYGQDAGYPGQFEFVGSDGYLWGGAPTADGAAPLWVTNDGGVSWHRASIGPSVYDVSAIGQNVWALTSACNANSAEGAAATSPCALVLEQSVDAGNSWRAVGGSGLTGLTNAPQSAQHVELARITRSRAYVLTDTADQLASDPNSGFGLVYTGDGGQTWSTRPVPCVGAFGLGAEIAASGTDDLWILCGSQASGGEQSKELYRSSDGGFTWALSASATGLGTPPPPASNPHTLPLGGYIAPFSIGHKNLAVLSPSAAWLYPTRSSLLETMDGGRSWSPVPDLVAAGFGAGSPGNVTFISATQGWICAYGVGLWHTSDGVHWSALGA
jgi:photosystem II stability/assembly factor-like uncharacterized protein